MAQMFWVQCPDCDGRFYCHTEDLWDSGYDLLCPYCAKTFTQEEGLVGMKQPPKPSGPAARP
jgi:hypothetical protein